MHNTTSAARKMWTPELSGTCSAMAARLPAVFSENGIGFTIARLWDGDKTLERQLKRRKNGRRLCPICGKDSR